jgi:hypothetical protein
MEAYASMGAVTVAWTAPSSPVVLLTSAFGIGLAEFDATAPSARDRPGIGGPRIRGIDGGSGWTKTGSVDDQLVKPWLQIVEDEMTLLVDLAIDRIFVLRTYEFDARLRDRRAGGGVDYVAFHDGSHGVRGLGS